MPGCLSFQSLQTQGAMKSALTIFVALAALTMLEGCARDAVPAGGPSCPPATPPATSAVPFDPGDGQFDVVELLRDAKAAIRADHGEEALSRLLWAFDYGPIVKESSIGVVGTDVPPLLASLGASYPPALVALRARKRWLEGALRAGSPLPRSSVLLYKEAARALRQVGDALQTCRMLAANPRLAEQRELLCWTLVDDLLDAGMWGEAVSVAENEFSRLQAYREMEQQYPVGPTFYERIARTAGRLLGAMLRLKKEEEALRFAERWLDALPRAYNYAGMIAEARDLGSADLANRLRRRAVLKLEQTEIELLKRLQP